MMDLLKKENGESKAWEVVIITTVNTIFMEQVNIVWVGQTTTEVSDVTIREEEEREILTVAINVVRMVIFLESAQMNKVVRIAI